MAARIRKAEKFSHYDSADYLKTPDDVAEYLVAAFDEGGMTLHTWPTSSASRHVRTAE